MLKILFLLCLFCCVTPPTFAAEEAAMPYIIFRDEPQNPDLTLPNIHPKISDTRNDYHVVSVKERNRVRVALYDESFRGPRRLLLQNPTGQDLTGLPAGNPQDAPRDNEEGIRFGDNIMLKPFVEPSKTIGSPEWPNQLWWRRLHGNYYIVRLYRGESMLRDGLFTEKSGRDCSVFWGESFENPGKVDFCATFLGAEIDLFASGYPVMYLVSVDGKDLPADFPKGLVRWIP